MVAERKLLAGAHVENDPDNKPEGDSAWFVVYAVLAAETLNIKAPALMARSCWLFVSSSVHSTAPGKLHGHQRQRL